MQEEYGHGAHADPAPHGSQSPRSGGRVTAVLSLKTYDDWKYCITVLCRTPLTPDYVEQRLAALRDPADHGTRKFIATWGEAHLARVVGWFERAARELR